MLKTKEQCEGCEQEYFEAFKTDDDAWLCASCTVELLKADNAALQAAVGVEMRAKEGAQLQRDALQRQVEKSTELLVE